MPKRSLELPGLLDSWCRQLRGQRRSPHTIEVYRAGVERFLAYCANTGTPAELTKPNVTDWLESLHAAEASTVRLRLTAVKLFARWLAAEEDFDADPLTAIRAPKLAQAPVADLSDNEIMRMVKACAGTALRDKRDKTALLLLVETGLRAAELVALDMGDIDLDACLLVVRKGKGGKSRRVRFSSASAAAVDRYARARARAVRLPTLHRRPRAPAKRSGPPPPDAPR
jgi:site-specific recombinase XerD